MSKHIQAVSKPASEKIFWPTDGYTKQDLLDYYDAVAPYILPYTKERPLVLKRYSKGIEGDHFFQKDFTYSLPEYAKTIPIPTKGGEKEINYIICNNKETLHYLAHLDTIELHPWSSRVKHINNPDYMIFDLDPGPETTFIDVVNVAQQIHKELDSIALPNKCKTSGIKGLHIYALLDAREDYDAVRAKSREIAQRVIKSIPELASLEHNPQNRKDKVYIDILRNAYGQTAVAPYSLRAVPGAQVSTPVLWSEVNELLNPHEFTIKTIIKRVSKLGDLWQDFVR